MALLIHVLVTASVIGTLAADEAPAGQACGADVGPALDEASGAREYMDLHQLFLHVQKVPKALKADDAVEQAAAEAESDAVFDAVLEGDPRTDAANTMPAEEAQSLDELTMSAHPDVLPQAPSMYPGSLEALEAAIAPKLQGLTRHSLIRLPDGTEVPYWQTHQYANRHFRLTLTRFLEGERKGKTFDVIPEAGRVRIWAAHARMRKIMCTEAFREWVLSSAFGENKTAESVYARFEGVPQGSFVSVGELKKAKVAVATGKGVVISRSKFPDLSDHYLLGVYAHERSHNLGYSHQSQVPYPIQRWFTRVAGPGNVSSYESYDLVQHPEFEVVQR